MTPALHEVAAAVKGTEELHATLIALANRRRDDRIVFTAKLAGEMGADPEDVSRRLFALVALGCARRTPWGWEITADGMRALAIPVRELGGDRV